MRPPHNQTETFRRLPEEIRQLIVDLHCEMPAMSWRKIADICFIRFGRKPSHHSVKHIATSGTPPPLQAHRYLPWHQINSPTERRLAVVRLHSEGWSIRGAPILHEQRLSENSRSDVRRKRSKAEASQRHMDYLIKVN